MGRPPKFTIDQVLDVAEELVAGHGPNAATVPTIAERLNASSGSIYHRFRSRDLILAHLWIRTVRRAQEGFLAALNAGRSDAAAEAALHVPRWSRQHLAEARILTLYRREDLAVRWPAELGAELATLNDRLASSLREFARHHYGQTTPDRIETVTFALVDVPYAAVRRYLISGVPPPRSVDALVARVVEHLLGSYRPGEY